MKTINFVRIISELTKCPKPVVDCNYDHFIEGCHYMAREQVGCTSHEITSMNVEHYRVLLGKS